MHDPAPDLDHAGRCSWPGSDPLYIGYHDHEWGVPERDGRALFEKLILDGFQAGLSWITILRKRENFRRAFDNFDPELIARYGPEKIEALMADAGIVRNRGKIVSTVGSAQAWLNLRDGGVCFSAFLWDVVNGETLHNHWREKSDVPTETKESAAMTKKLKAAGFRFCGPTITYAFMQATGMVNDHYVACFRHKELMEADRRCGS